MQTLQNGDKGREPDREGRQKDVPRDHPNELQPRQQQRIEAHPVLPFCVAVTGTLHSAANAISADHLAVTMRIAFARTVLPLDGLPRLARQGEADSADSSRSCAPKNS
jgi:hypothetical protein